MNGSLLNNLHFLHLLHSVDFPCCLLTDFPYFTESSFAHHEVQLKTIQFNYSLHFSTLTLELISIALIDGSPFSFAHLPRRILFEFFTQLYTSESVIVHMSKCMEKYRKLPMRIFLSLSLDELVLLKPLFLVCLDVSILISESLVVRISFARLFIFRSKVNCRGIIAKLLSISLLSNSRGHSPRLYLILRIPCNDIVKFINPIKSTNKKY